MRSFPILSFLVLVQIYLNILIYATLISDSIFPRTDTEIYAL